MQEMLKKEVFDQIIKYVKLCCYDKGQTSVKSLTLRAAQSRVTDARVMVVPKVEEGAAIISVQVDALVDHPFNNIWSKHQRHHLFCLKKSGSSCKSARALGYSSTLRQ